MKIVLLIVVMGFLLSGNIYAEEVNYPYAEFKLQEIYQIDDGKVVYIEQTGVGHTIWVKHKSSKELNKISDVWFFYGIAKECDDKSLKNVLFASQKEYYMWGGIDENPAIRMYNLYEPHPHFTYHTDLGMVPHIKEAKEWCTFYEPVK